MFSLHVQRRRTRGLDQKYYGRLNCHNKHHLNGKEKVGAGGDDFLFFLSQSTPPYLVFRTEAFHLNFSFDILSEICMTRTTSCTISCGGAAVKVPVFDHTLSCAVRRYQIRVKYSEMRNVRMRRESPPTSQHDSGEVLSSKHRL